MPCNVATATFLALLSLLPARGGVAVVSTLAGRADNGPSPPPNFADGVGTNALFSQPSGVAFIALPAPLLVVADYGNNIVRSLPLDGETPTSTLAGGGGLGCGDGSGTLAFFSGPIGLAAAPSGLVYVTDFGCGTLRVLDSGGVVTTLAGSPPVDNDNFADGLGTNARFSGPAGVVASSRPGNPDVPVIYVADLFNNRIRTVTLDGLVTTLAGFWEGDGNQGAFADGVGTAARFFHPWGLANDPYRAYGLLVCDTANNRIRAVDEMGVVTTFAGSGGSGFPGSFADGAGSAALFAIPQDIAVVNGVVYVADSMNSRIRAIDAAGFVSTVAGDGRQTDVDGVGTAASLGSPIGLTAGVGALYVTDEINVIRAVTFSSSSVTPSATLSQTTSGSRSPSPTVTSTATATPSVTPTESPTSSLTASPSAAPPPPPPARTSALTIFGAAAGGAVTLALAIAGVLALRRRAAPSFAASGDMRGEFAASGDYAELRVN